jgi:hypothetical protein
MIMKKFRQTLERFGVRGFDSVGEHFNPQLHEAISQIETTEHPDRTIVVEYLRGYLLNDRLIRPALVVVARNPATPEPLVAVGAAQVASAEVPEVFAEDAATGGEVPEVAAEEVAAIAKGPEVDTGEVAASGEVPEVDGVADSMVQKGANTKATAPVEAERHAPIEPAPGTVKGSESDVAEDASAQVTRDSGNEMVDMGEVGPAEEENPNTLDQLDEDVTIQVFAVTESDD